ncbi:hypothetical protein [Burkholderia glumae]|nr:hypothetical protein [Burkholderia glumae]MCM2494370.1 hypothetical protein [Burkholderia glumae]MCM2545317.1 hypothetical protein [Burkholderia glumae]QHE12271.1 hypothetical protein GQR88_17835 [Burkholderia glumae AU6208]
MLRLHMIDARIPMNGFACFDHGLRKAESGKPKGVPARCSELHSIGY